MKHLTPDSSASATGVGIWGSSGVLCSLLFPAWTSRVPLGEGPTGRRPVVLGRSALHPSQGTPSWCGKLLFWTDFGSSCTKSPSSQASRGCQPQGWGWVGGCSPYEQPLLRSQAAEEARLLRRVRGRVRDFSGMPLPWSLHTRPVWVPFPPAGVFADARSLRACMIWGVGSTE